jgi:FkbM family methyltransferase
MKIHKSWYLPDLESHFQDNFKYINGEYTYQQMQRDASLKYISNQRTAIDIGANIGLWAKDLCQTFKKVILFEPYNKNIECLKKNLEQFDNYYLYDLALSNRNSYEELYVNDELTGYSSFDSRDHIDPESNLLNVKKINVKTIKLDDLNLQDIDYIKIDVQFHELEVIEGSIDTLKNNNPVLCIEAARRNEEELSYVRKFANILVSLKYKIVGSSGKELFFKK